MYRAPSAGAADVYRGDGGISGGEGAFNNEGPENLLPGSPRAEEWAASRERERERESKLYAMTDDESRGTPS